MGLIGKKELKLRRSFKLRSNVKAESIVEAGFYIVLLVFLIFNFVRTTFPWQMDYVEGLTAYISSLIFSGVDVYSATPSHNGFTAASYPILAYVPTLLSYAVFGRSIGMLVFARIFYLLSSIASIVLVYKISYALFKNRLAGFTSVLALVSLRPFSYWAPMVRSDVLALPLILTTLYMVYRGKYVFLVALIPAVLCVKQQYFDLVLALTLYSIATRDRGLLKYVLFSFLIASLTYSIHELVFPGFFKATFIYNAAHERSFAHALAILKHSLLFSPWSTVAVLVSTVASLYIVYRSRSGLGFLVSTYFLTNFTLSMVLSSKLGSNTNYFLISSALISILLPYLYAKCSSKCLGSVLALVFATAGLWGIVDSYGFNIEAYVEGMALHETFASLGEKGFTAWCTDYFEAFLSGLWVPVDAFYFSRLVEANVLPDLNMLNIGLDIVIWDYNPWRITEYVRELIEASSPLVLGDYLGVYSIGGRVFDEFALVYARNYSKYYVSAMKSIYGLFGLAKGACGILEFFTLAFLALLILCCFKNYLNYFAKKFS